MNALPRFAATLLLGVAASGPALAQTLNVVGPWEIAGIDPAQSGYVFSRMQVAETLVSTTPEGALAPGLAESWAVDEDGLTWRFTLRDDAVFHDGAPVTAEIAARALQLAYEGVSVLNQAPIAEIKADGREVTIRLESPFAALPAYLVHFSTIILAPSSYDENGRVVRIVGSGPYRVAALAAPLRMELEDSGSWWGGRPGIGKIVYAAAGRDETRAIMAESGEADLVFSVLPVSVDRLRRNPDLNVQIATIPRTRILKVNAASPFFDSVEERRAVSLALDRAGIAQVILRNPDLAATQLFPPALSGWNQPDLPPLTRDLDQARRLLAEAGWTLGRVGVLEQEGRPFRVTLLTYSNWPELPPIATAIQAQLREVGIDLQVSVGNSSEIPARHRDGALEIALISRLYSIVPDPIGALRNDYGPGGSDWGAMGWENAELQTLVAELAATSDPDLRAPLRRRAVEILQDELPSIPVAWSELAIVSNKRIVNVQVDPLEVNYGLAAIRWAE